MLGKDVAPLGSFLRSSGRRDRRAAAGSAENDCRMQYEDCTVGVDRRADRRLGREGSLGPLQGEYSAGLVLVRVQGSKRTALYAAVLAAEVGEGGSLGMWDRTRSGQEVDTALQRGREERLAVGEEASAPR